MNNVVGGEILEKNFYFGGNILPSRLGIKNYKLEEKIKIPKEVQNQKDYKNLKKYYFNKREGN